MIPCIHLQANTRYKEELISCHVTPVYITASIYLFNAVVLDIPLDYSLDDCIEYIQEDELVDVTPSSMYMCKNAKLAKKTR